MTNKWIRRQAKQDKARYGMRVDGAGIKGLPTGGTHEYELHLAGVGTFYVSARDLKEARRKLYRMLPKHIKKLGSPDTLDIVQRETR